MKLSSQELEKIRTFFKDKPAKKVYLFGSFARGDADENSDVDLLIDWDYSKIIGLDYIGWWLDIKELLKKDVDFVSVEFVSPLIKDYIEQDKTLIYEA
ncbi:MAG: nucleotidyltransferase domain-containing protein [Bergeyella sp.]